jgi:hypothetical protein
MKNPLYMTICGLVLLTALVYCVSMPHAVKGQDLTGGACGCDNDKNHDCRTHTNCFNSLAWCKSGTGIGTCRDTKGGVCCSGTNCTSPSTCEKSCQ